EELTERGFSIDIVWPEYKLQMGHVSKHALPFNLGPFKQ
ncbi:MAG: hypothetical protein ACI9VI_002849, partial [Candidatus Azotimanducaceae bacterium]